MRIIPFPIVLHIAIALAATVAHAGLEVSYPYPDETYTACGVMPGQQISPWPTNATYSYNKWEYPYYQNMWSGVGTTFPWGKVYGSAGGPADYYISGWKYTEEGGTSAGSSGNVTGGFSMNASTDPGEYTVTYTRKDASVRPWKIVAQPNIGNGPDYNTYQETFSFSLYHAEFKSLSTSEKTVILFNGSASFDAADALSPRCYIPSNDITYSVSRSEDATVDTYGDVTFTKDGSFDVGVYHGNYSSAPANITITVVPELSNATVSSGNWSASANRSGNSSVTMFDLRDSSGCLSLTLDLDANANSGTFASGNPTWTMTGQASGNTSGNSSSFNLTAAGNYTVKVKSHSGDESNSSDEIKLDVELFGVDWTSWISDGSAYTPGNVTSTSSSDNLYVFYPHSASPGETKNKTVSMTLNASHGTTTKHGEFKYEAYKGSTSQGSPSYFSSGDGSGSVDLSYETSNSSSTDYVIKITDSLGLDFGNPDVSIAPVDWTVWASDGYIAYTPSSVNSTSTNRTLYVLVETTGNASDTMNVTIDLTLNATAGGTNYADLFKYTVTGTNAPSGADLPSSGSANFTLQYSGNLASASNYTVEFVAINGSASYGNMTVALLPVDIDVVHPATGEMSESREASEGGLVAIRRDAGTPITKLKLHKLEGMANSQFKLVFGSKIKLWKHNDNGYLSDPIVTGNTTFPADQDTEIYVEGVTKSNTAKDVEVGLKVVIGSTESSPVPIKLTVVDGEFEVQAKMWIREQWIDTPPHPTIHFGGYKIAGGDDRDNNNSPTAAYRVTQKVVIVPYKDLDLDGIKDDHVPFIYKMNSPGLSSLWVKSASVPNPSDPYSASNRFLSTATPSSTAPPDVTRMHIDGLSRTNDKVSRVRFHGAANDPLVPFSFDINWDITVAIDGTDVLEPKYVIEGNHDDYPAFEIDFGDSIGRRSPQPYFWLHPLPSDVFDLAPGGSITIPSTTKGDIR